MPTREPDKPAESRFRAAPLYAATRRLFSRGASEIHDRRQPIREQD